MTPCEKLGYKVGDRFEVVKGDGSSGMSIGNTVVLVEDDGTGSPYFKVEGHEHGSYECGYLSSLRPLKPQTEAEKRGAKFGTMGVVKATGERCVYIDESLVLPGHWEIDVKGKANRWHRGPSEIRLDHEPEYKEIPFSEATEEQRMDVGNLSHNGGRKVSQIVMFDNGTYGFTISGMCSVFMDTYNITVRVPS